MARYRSIQTAFWQDNFVMKLPLIEKAFYNYLLTNTRTNQCGIYSFSVTLTSVELGCSEEEVKKLLDRFVAYGKIFYDEEHEEIMLLNWYKYNLNISKNTLICVNRELEDVKNKGFIRKFYELCKSKRYPLDIIFHGIDVEKLNEDIVIMAIGEAVKNNGKNLKYVEGILINWYREGLRTVEEVKAYLENWKNTTRKRLKEPKHIFNADAYRIIGEE